MIASHRDCVITVVTEDRLPAVKAFTELLREVSEPQLFICVIGTTSLGHETGVTYLSEHDLGLPHFDRFAFQYTAFEFCCAIKPWLIAYALEKGFDRVLYFDCDIGIYAPLEPVFEALDNDDVLLTRHQSPNTPNDGFIPTRGQLRSAGLFNAGFVGVAGTENGRKFADWWQSHCKTNAYVDISGGVFVDQSWLDFAPLDCEGVRTNCPHGWNTAYWNLSEQPVRLSAEGALLAGESPLIFFHYSGFDWKNVDELSRYQNRHQLAEMPVLREVVVEYAGRLERHWKAATQNSGYKYGFLSDGTTISPLWREAVRTNHPLLRGVANPFDVSATPGLKQLFKKAAVNVLDSRHDWRQQAAKELGKRIEATPLLGRIYRQARALVERYR